MTEQRLMDKIQLICCDCGLSPKRDETKSNENWDVFDAKCPCGGKLRLRDTYQRERLKKVINDTVVGVLND